MKDESKFLKRFVPPKTWTRLNSVEHPPLMMKPLVQGVCGGLRWLEAKGLAQFIAKKSVEDGFPCTKATRKALGAKKPTQLRKREFQQQMTAESRMPAAGVVASHAKQRLVSYDVLDCTFGSGYHSGAVLENGWPYTRVVALDCDPWSVTAARDIVSEFGDHRFRFHCCKMSEIFAMFGENSFDAVIIDPGPSVTQLENPERGFLLDDENHHCFDMRYGRQNGMSAVQYLNTVPQHALSNSLASYGLLTPEQSMKMARSVRQGRPFSNSRQVLETIQAAGEELPDEGWYTQLSRRKSPMSWKFLTSLRCIVNNERIELEEALKYSMLILRADGRVAVVTRLKWEEDLVRCVIDEHPHALLCYNEDIDVDDIQNHGHGRHTKLWVVTRVKRSSFPEKNSLQLTDEKVRDSSIRWMSGLFAGQTHGFPANNFAFHSKDSKEWKVSRGNASPPPFDRDEQE